VRQQHRLSDLGIGARDVFDANLAAQTVVELASNDPELIAGFLNGRSANGGLDFF
jgi:phage FluMu protein gp41